MNISRILLIILVPLLIIEMVLDYFYNKHIEEMIVRKFGRWFDGESGQFNQIIEQYLSEKEDNRIKNDTEKKIK